MCKEELIVLKYINKYKELPTEQIYKKFCKVIFFKKFFFRKQSCVKYSEESIYGVLWYLEVNHDYIREHNGMYKITDRGEIEAYSHIIELREIWKNRFIGFFFGILATVIATGIIEFPTFLMRILR